MGMRALLTFGICVGLASSLAACSSATDEATGLAEGASTACAPTFAKGALVVNAHGLERYEGDTLHVLAGGVSAAATIVNGKATLRLAKAVTEGTFGTMVTGYIDGNGDGTGCEGSDPVWMGHVSTGTFKPVTTFEFAPFDPHNGFLSPVGCDVLPEDARAPLPPPAPAFRKGALIVNAEGLARYEGRTLHVFATGIEATAVVAGGKATLRLEDAVVENSFATSVIVYADVTGGAPSCEAGDPVWMVFPPTRGFAPETTMTFDPDATGVARDVTCDLLPR